MAETADRMPGEEPRTGSARQVLAAWLLALLLLAAIDVPAEIVRRRNEQADPGSIASRWRRAARDEPPHDCVVLGDSSAESAVDPVLLARLLGGTVASYPQRSGPPWLDAWMLGEYIRHHGAPRRVVLIHAYDLWHRGLSPLVAARVPLPWGFWRGVSPSIRPSAGRWSKMLLCRWCALYGDRNLWRHEAERLPLALTRACSGLRAHAEPPPPAVDGYWPRPSQDAASLAQELRNHLARLSRPRPDFAPAPLNIEAIAAIAALSARHGFAVYVAAGPLHEELAQLPSYRALQTQIATAAEGAGRAGSVHCLRDLDNSIPGALLGDTVDHTQAAGAHVYTRALAEALLRLKPRATPRP